MNCCGALHLFPDARGALREIARVLAPGGRFSVATFRRRQGRLVGWMDQRQARFWGLANFTSDELARWMEDTGLSDARVLHGRGRWLIMSAVRDGGSTSAAT